MQTLCSSSREKERVRDRLFDVWAMPIYTDYFSKMGFPYYILLPPTTAYYISKQDPDRVCDFFEQFNRDFEHLFYLLNCSKWLETFGDLFSQKLEENKLGTNKNEKLKFTIMSNILCIPQLTLPVCLFLT